MAGDKASDLLRRREASQSRRSVTTIDGGGKMPSRAAIFSRLYGMATGLTPNPAEKVPGAVHGVTPPRMVGNFSDRKAPHKIMDLWRAVRTGTVGRD